MSGAALLELHCPLPAVRQVTFRAQPFWVVADPFVLDSMWDEMDLRERWWRPAAGDVVVDVGAQYGSYTLTALALGAKVVAVEPFPDLVDVIDFEVHLNHFEQRCVLYAKALYDGGPYPSELVAEIVAKTEEGALETDPQGRGAYAILADPARYMTLDDLVEHDCLMVGERVFRRLDWLKIDVEGGELGVLRGALRTLERFRPKVIVEDHTGIYDWCTREGTRAAVTGLLESLGYSVCPDDYGHRTMLVTQ